MALGDLRDSQSKYRKKSILEIPTAYRPSSTAGDGLTIKSFSLQQGEQGCPPSLLQCFHFRFPMLPPNYSPWEFSTWSLEFSSPGGSLLERKKLSLFFRGADGSILIRLIRSPPPPKVSVTKPG